MKNRLRRRTGPYREIVRAAWQNLDHPLYAWRILRDGVCDGCALGTTGLRDWTMDEVHLCWIRLNLLRLNTMPAFKPEALSDIQRLRSMSEKQLRSLGRLPAPFVRQRGEAGFRPVTWEVALHRIAGRISKTPAEKLAFYLVSRGTANETYYVAQKVARFLGTNHIDNSARVCHAASTTGLKKGIGYAATTCSYSDVIGTDLLVFIGSDAANNQPVMMKYVHLAKKAGTRVVVINPFREPGMEKYWVPSNVDSALFGTRIYDDYIQVRVGGDIAFLSGVLKHLIQQDWIDHSFIRQHTTGWEELKSSLEGYSFERLERESGVSRDEMLDFARKYGNARHAIFVWSMGITQHHFGTDNVRAITNLALARGSVGREKAGLMPIRGHSGVQGGAEMACIPNKFPGGAEINSENARRLEEMWGFPVPDRRGYFALDMIDAADRGSLDVLYTVGGNLLNILPDSHWVAAALEKVGFRVHHDIVVNPQMLVEPGEEVVLLPATTRYELAGGCTETTTERRVIFSPEIPGPRIAEASDEWRTLIEIGQRIKPEMAEKVSFSDTAAIRDEISRVIPLYLGIETLKKKGDQFQWGGEQLCRNGEFGFPDGRGRFASVEPPGHDLAEGEFYLLTRRGKQFNSMVFGQRDMLVGAARDEVVFSPDDFTELGLSEGAPVKIRSSCGELKGRAVRGDLRPGTIMMYWPEANVLIPRNRVDPECGIPAYRDAVVEVLPQNH